MTKKAFSTTRKAYPDVSKYSFDTSGYAVLRMSSSKATTVVAKGSVRAQPVDKKGSKK